MSNVSYDANPYVRAILSDVVTCPIPVQPSIAGNKFEEIKHIKNAPKETRDENNQDCRLHEVAIWKQKQVRMM